MLLLKNVKKMNRIIKRKTKTKIKRRTKSHKKILYFTFILISVLIIFYGILKNLGILKFHTLFKPIFNNSISFKKYQKIFLNKSEMIDNYLSSIPSKYIIEKRTEKEKIKNFLNLKVLSNNNTKNDELKMELINVLNNWINNKNITNINTIFFTQPGSFGNRMTMINNIIFYSELLNIKNLYFNSDYNFLIKNQIITDKLNINIKSYSQINCNDKNILCVSLIGLGFLFYPIVIRPEIKIYILKNEIKRNLPNIEIDSNDLVIHIRSGDIFSTNIVYTYGQPPLCFYQKILNEFKFKNIYLIAQNKENPVINNLLSEFPKIIYKENNIETDIAYLSNAYNLVGSKSSFSFMSIKLNDILKNYWEYDIFTIPQKFIFYI